MNTNDQIARMNELDKLAKLLATEDVLIEHKNVQTASFDTKHRVLTLPTWKNVSKTLYHMLIEHEIGHALYTPSKEWIQTVTENVGIRDILNVIEDARIERLIKDKYPGTRRDFREGYKHMFDSDFFKIKNRRMSSFPLIDRINLYYKLGDHTKIPFTHKEKLIIGEIDKLVTFEDAIALAKRLTKLIMKANDFSESLENDETDETDDSDSTTESIEVLPDSNTPVGNIIDNEVDDSKNDSSTSYEPKNDDSVNQSPITDSETIKALENAMNSIIDPSDRVNNTYYRAEAPKNWQTYIVDYATVLAEVRNNSDLSMGIAAFNKLRNTSNRVVDYILKEFQVRKAADQYVRTRESKTGVINPARLYAYRMSDDIFRRVSISPDSKNHGIVMFVDFSGSMRDNMKNTIEQLINLVLFCRKANIPHRVYGFTDADIDIDMPINNEKKRYNHTLTPNPFMKIIELYHESMKLNEFRDMTSALMIQFDYNLNQNLSARCKYFKLNTTPLDCTILIARPLLKMFKKQTNTQIISTVFLTDGESSGTFFVDNTRPSSQLGTEHEDRSVKTFFRNRNQVIYDPVHHKYYINNTNYENWREFSQFATSTLLKILKSDGYHTIGFRIDKASKIKAKIHTFYNQIKNIESVQKEFKKNGCATVFDVCGYDELHMINNIDFSDNNDEGDEFSFEIKENATKVQIKKAFIEARTDRINSRIILNNFAKRIST